MPKISLLVLGLCLAIPIGASGQMTGQGAVKSNAPPPSPPGGGGCVPSSVNNWCSNSSNFSSTPSGDTRAKLAPLTPGDNSRVNPTSDPDVRKGANDYCKTHRGGVCDE